ncbi:DUF4179 domain-containing protein [Paenibacillus kandeliae]|uniref:DUF4179 domain-containing protein n=1 Tax=Paenibacillus kandeliae TaxID=3231269 RepID=UPI003458824B
MMNTEDKLEQILRKEAHQWRDQQSNAQDWETTRAIRLGLQQRSSIIRRSRWRYGWRIGVTSAIVMTLILFAGMHLWSPFLLTPASSVSNEKVHENWGKLEPYRELTEKSILYNHVHTAIQQHYVQYLGKTVEHRGIQFTIDAVIADQQNLYFFFTVSTNQPLGIMRPDLVRFFNSDNMSLISDMSSIDSDSNPATSQDLRGIGSILLDSQQPFPDDITARIRIKTVSLEQWTTSTLNNEVIAKPVPAFVIPFRLAPQFSLQQEQTLPVHASFTWGDGQITTNQFSILPLTTSLQIKLDDQAKQQLEKTGPPDVYLLSNSSGSSTKLVSTSTWSSTLDDGTTIVNYRFGSTILEQPEDMYIVLHDGTKQEQKYRVSLSK